MTVASLQWLVFKEICKTRKICDYPRLNKIEALGPSLK